MSDIGSGFADVSEEEQIQIRESFISGMRKLTSDEGMALLIVFAKVLALYPGRLPGVKDGTTQP